ncbi:tagaturonate epimerase family protein [Candidatus Neomarinimicrobiota bacterium]
MIDTLKPSLLGLKRSFGFGDRLGLATPGHIDAIRNTPFLPIFAQQSIRELKRTGRKPEDVMSAAQTAVETERWTKPWGADADHLQNRDDVLLMADCGYTFFTIDPSEYVDFHADTMSSQKLKSTYRDLVNGDCLTDSNIYDIYFNSIQELDDGILLKFDNASDLLRAIVKYGRALKYTNDMFGWILEAMGERPFEVELSIDETPTPTTPLEHLFIGMELKRMDVNVISIAPRFIGEFEKGIDYKGDLTIFTKHYKQHAAIARYCGPYKISIHSGSDKFAIYPIIGKLSKEYIHVKTAGTSYLEALRVICRTNIDLFRKLIEFSRERYTKDRTSYHVSANLNDIPAYLNDNELEKWYLDSEFGRQVLHVTFGSILLKKNNNGKNFKEQILECVTIHKDLYRELLQKHLSKHISLLMREY